MPSVIRIQTADFDLGSEIAQLRAGRSDVGAVVSFIGTVRDMNAGDAVFGLRLEHYPGMTEAVLQSLVDQARARWAIQEVCLIHRVGALRPGAQIVLVITTAAHRAAAFAACEFLIDRLKTAAPFWKQEQTPNGPRWVAARPADSAAADRWGQS